MECHVGVPMLGSKKNYINKYLARHLLLIITHTSGKSSRACEGYGC